MSHHLGRVVSDLSHSNSRGARGRGLRHQSTATSNTDGGGNGGKAKQKLALLFSGVVAWTRSESSAATEAGSGRAKNRKQETTRAGTGARRRGLDIVVAVRKYVSMVEQLFASYSGGSSSSSSRDGDGRDVRRRRVHTFTYGRGGGSTASSKRHKGRLSSAPASLRGSPANSGHLSVGDSVTKTSTPSEVSTMEELRSAIQAAIAHCKNSGVATSQSAAGGGGDKQQQEERKC
ncbi:hypothetical protein SETIT_6G182000v2 [Setaria italica]|uniref:BRI1 kinase inhibitor 1 n=1 Tax=Setaria italica TaxID=4555 RepID=K3YJH7_SETIT|nr:probable BRI1 kinase inhibitor 1 [Setaria italica]RCV31490.1 hypothetical protein SETIT_6G182000v2 [Setaria italica]